MGEAMATASGSKTLMLLMGAVGFGIAAAILSVLYLQSREAAIIKSLKGDEQQMVGVVVANQDLQKGQKIEAGYFAVRNIPLTYVHPNAVTPQNIESFYGRFLVEDLSRGKPLLTNFMNETFPVDFSDLVSKGRRAITIQVDEVQSIAGMTRPGNKIDIYVNIPVKVAGYEEEPAPGEQPESGMQQAALQAAASFGVEVPPEALDAIAANVENKPADVILPVLQNVRVLATGREAYDESLDSISYPQRRSELNYTSMTVDVSPEQAALLAIAEDKGDLIAVLRNRNDQHTAQFTGITPFDLFSNASEMKKQAAIRKAAEAAGATIDENGNWVANDGTVIKKENLVISESGTVTTKGGQLLASNGVSVNKNGQYVDAEGKVIPPDQIIVNADGTITSKDEVLKAAGYTRNADGDYVDAQGNVIDKEDIVVAADGSIINKEQAMRAAGYTKNADGDYVDASGNVVKKEDIAVAADGTIINKDEIMKAAGYTKNADGDYVDASGNVVKADEIKVLSNGSVIADGKAVSGPKVTVNKEGFIISEDGTVMTADGKVLSGVSVNEQGQVVGPDGEILTDANLTVAADGTVRDSSGNLVAGVSGSDLPPEVTAPDVQPFLARLSNFVSLIVGGASKDGVAKTSLLPVEPLAGQLPETEQ
jgi:pilus assembly protein CpaB